MLKKLTNFIGGTHRAPASGQYFESLIPATGQAHALVPDSDERDIDEAVKAAKEAQKPWAAKPASERAAVLNRIAAVLETRLDAFAEAESRDQGKPVSLARRVDIPRAVANFRFFAGAILHHCDQTTSMDGALNYAFRKPVGVAGLISPWNLPLYLLTWKIAPALATGNTAVCKPSELTSYTAFLLTDVFEEAGLPPGVCNMVFGTGPKAGAALVKHRDVPLISFTGGTATAETIIRDSASGFKKLGLELGGKNANIVFADADLEQSLATSLRAAFTNQGEICLCGSRILVEQPVYAAFCTRFSEMAAALKTGDPADPESDLGALISGQHLEKVRGYIQLAGEEGGEILTGGETPPLDPPFDKGYFLQPTVIAGLTPACRVMQEEIFGPVVTITPFNSEAEAIAMANSTRYGLSAVIWTQNAGRAHRVAQAMDAGIVWVNTWMMRDLRTPFGGMKASGLGREGGIHSIDFYTEVQNICIKH